MANVNSTQRGLYDNGFSFDSYFIGLSGINTVAPYSGTYTLNNGYNFQNFSGASVLVIPSGLELQTHQIVVQDWFGTAGVSGANIIVSGAAGVTVNGGTKVTLATNYLSMNFRNSGTSAWIQG